MNLVRCEAGHFYDADRWFNGCPHCVNLNKNENTMTKSMFDNDDTPFTRRTWGHEADAPIGEDVKIKDILKSGQAYYSTMSGLRIYDDSARVESSFVCNPTENARDIYIIGLNNHLRTSSITLSAPGLRYSSISFFTYWGSSLQDTDDVIDEQIEMVERELENLDSFMENLAEKADSLENYMNQHKAAGEYYRKLQQKEKELKSKKEDKSDDLLFGIHVHLQDEVREETRVSLSYIYENIYWKPYFIINADSAKDVVGVDFYAEIHSDIDLKELPVTVSTGLDAKMIPEIRKFVVTRKQVNEYVPSPMYAPSYSAPIECYEGSRRRGLFRKNKSVGSVDQDLESSTYEMIGDDYEEEAVSKESVDVELAISDFKQSREYRLREAITVNANEPQGILLETTEHRVEKNYLLVPSENPNAFLLMKSDELKTVFEESMKKMKNARVEIFLDREYLRTQKVEKMSLEHGLILSVIEGIRSRRTVLDTKTSSNVVLRKKMIRNKYRIDIENKLEQNAKVLVYDNIPVTEEDDIQIEINESSKAAIDRKTGIATWELNTEPGVKYGLAVEYSITYPSGISIQTER